jgi:O-antigen ligase
MNVIVINLKKSSVDRFLVGILILIACFGQPNALYLVVPYFYLLLAVYFLLLLFYLLLKNDFRVGSWIPSLIIGIPLAAFFLLAGASVINAREPVFSVTLLASAALKVVMFYMLQTVACRTQINDVVACVIIRVAVFFSITGIAMFIGIVLFNLEPIRELGLTDVGGGLEYEQKLLFYGLGFVRSSTSLLDVVFPRLQSFFAEPGYFGLFLELSLFATLYCKYVDVRASSHARHLNLALVLQLVALLLSLSLGAMAAIGGGMFVYWLATPKLRVNFATITKVASALFTGALLLPFWSIAEGPLSLIYNIVVGERFETAYGVNSADTRMSVFQLGLNLIEQRPVFGWGFGQVRIVLDGMGVNNSFLTVFAELGVFGLLAYLAVIFVVFLTVYRSLALSKPHGPNMVRATAAIAGMVVAITLHSLMIDISWSFIYWLAISLVFLHHRHLLVIRNVD